MLGSADIALDSLNYGNQGYEISSESWTLSMTNTKHSKQNSSVNQVSRQGDGKSNTVQSSTICGRTETSEIIPKTKQIRRCKQLYLFFITSNMKLFETKIFVAFIIMQITISVMSLCLWVPYTMQNHFIVASISFILAIITEDIFTPKD